MTCGNRLLLLFLILALSTQTLSAAQKPRLEHITPALFELEPNARFAGTDLDTWQVFTRTGVQLSPDVSIAFSGVDEGMRMEGLDRSKAKLSVYQGNDSSKWKAECGSYGALAYRGLYAGIDLVYKRSEGRLKGDFIVQPGADPSLIRFRVNGGTVLVDPDRLEIQSSGRKLVERIPSVYDLASSDANTKRMIALSAHYRKYADGSIGFDVEGHDPRLQLVIDPDLTFSTFLAGSLLDQVTTVAYASGILLVGGWTESPNFYGVSNKHAGSTDAFYGQFAVSSAGVVTFLNMTLFGGSGMDRVNSIGFNGYGVVVLGGTTTSTNFPLYLPYQGAMKGTQSGFIIELTSPFGTGVAYSTYFGGNGADSINGIAIDNSFIVYFAGTTSSANLPVKNAAQSHFGGGTVSGLQNDGFVATINANLSIGYCTYLGGTNDDSIAGLAVSGGQVWVTGNTDSTNFPVLNAFQPQTGGGQDAFITKLTTAGAIAYSSYLGGSGGTVAFPEAGNAVAIDSAGNAYVVGMTSSANFPVTTGAAQSSFGGGATDAFLAKVSSTGALVFATYWGGSDWDQANAVAVLPSGFVAVAGSTTSFDFPTLMTLPTGSVNSGAYDAFVAVFSPVGALYWSTYFGGSGTDAAYGMAVNPAGEIYIGGLTGSYNLPQVNGLQSTINSVGYHGFLARITPTKQEGVFRVGNGAFYLATSDTFGFSTYTTYSWANVSGSDAIPVVGDWDSTGRTRLGIYRSGTWYLDIDGDNLFTPGVDKVVTGFGYAGAYPVVGDWDNTGLVRLGYFYYGIWYFDTNNDYVYEPNIDRHVAYGAFGDIPLVGDWTNSGQTRIGVVRSNIWLLDLNGDFTYTSGVDSAYSFGASTDYPVFTDWDNTGVKRIGTYRTVGYPIGWWYADINNNHVFDGVPPDKNFIFGGTGDIPVVGVRSH